jgi:RHS repeat-associated protein
LPFGEDGGVTGENEKHRFTNYERDAESGTDYAVNRLYSTSTGRFFQPDVIGGQRLNPQSLNRYAYSVNNPVDFYDPLGLNPQKVTCYADGFEIPCDILYSLLFSEAAEYYEYSSDGITYYTLDKSQFYSVEEEPGGWYWDPETGFEQAIKFVVTFNYSEWLKAQGIFGNHLFIASLNYDDEFKARMREMGDELANSLAPGAGIINKGAKIGHGILAKLIQKVGKGNAGKFEKALEKGIVGPTGQSGIKILRVAEGKYTHELKIGGSADRLLGYVDESGEIIFDKIVKGGLH